MTQDRSTEDEVLLTTARVDLTEYDRTRLQAALHRDANWDVIVRAALQHGTAPLLCRHILMSATGSVAPELFGAASHFLVHHRRRADRAMGELLDVLDALARAGIAAIPFKGPILASQAYGGPEMRGCRDLDFLIREEHVVPTMRVLADLGFRSQADDLEPWQLQAYFRYNGQDILFAHGKMPVEPHWTFAPRTFNVRLDMTGIWDRAAQVVVAGQTIPCLSPEDTLLVAALHGAKEHWDRLIWIVDISEYLKRSPDLDWDLLLGRAADAGLLRITLLSLAASELLVGALLPERVSAEIQRDRTCQALARQVAARLFGSRTVQRSVFSVSEFHWRAREQKHDQIRYLFSTLTTARLPHFRKISLGERLSFAYPFVKVMHDYLALPLWSAARSLTPRGFTSDRDRKV